MQVRGRVTSGVIESWMVLRSAIVGAAVLFAALAAVCAVVLSSSPPAASASLAGAVQAAQAGAQAAKAGELQALAAIAPWAASTSAKRASLLRTIRNEATAAGVPLRAKEAAEAKISATATVQTLLADTRIGGGGAKKAQILDYIQQQQQLLSKIESLSGVYALPDGAGEHHFPKHVEKAEHYHNIFAKHHKDEDDYDPDAFGKQQPDNSGDASARAWHMIDPASSTAKYKPKHRDDSWHGEEDALSAIQAKAEARLKKDETAQQDESNGDATFDNADNSTVIDDSGEEVPSNSIGAVAAAMGYHSVNAFLQDEKKEAAAARAEAIKEEKTREKVGNTHICFDTRSASQTRVCVCISLHTRRYIYASRSLAVCLCVCMHE